MVEKIALELGNALLGHDRHEWDRLSGELYDAMERESEPYDEVSILDDSVVVTRLPHGTGPVVAIRIHGLQNIPMDDKESFVGSIYNLAINGALP